LRAGVSKQAEQTNSLFGEDGKAKMVRSCQDDDGNAEKVRSLVQASDAADNEILKRGDGVVLAVFPVFPCLSSLSFDGLRKSSTEKFPMMQGGSAFAAFVERGPSMCTAAELIMGGFTT